MFDEIRCYPTATSRAWLWEGLKDLDLVVHPGGAGKLQPFFTNNLMAYNQSLMGYKLRSS